jgi:hypothetical protein
VIRSKCDEGCNVGGDITWHPWNDSLPSPSLRQPPPYIARKVVSATLTLCSNNRHRFIAAPQEPFKSTSVDSSDDDYNVPLRDKRRRDGVPSSIENSIPRAHALSPPVGSQKHHGEGDWLVSIAGPDIGGSGSQSKLCVTITSGATLT